MDTLLSILGPVAVVVVGAAVVALCVWLLSLPDEVNLEEEVSRVLAREKKRKRKQQASGGTTATVCDDTPSPWDELSEEEREYLRRYFR